MHFKALCYSRLKRETIIKTRPDVIGMLRIMKLTAIFLLGICLQVSASGYGQKVTLSEKNASLQKIFRQIHRQTGYQFFYQDELLDKAGKLNIEVKDRPLEEVLALCFKNLPATYAIIGNTIVVSEKKENDLAEEQNPLIDVTGYITDDNGTPVAGASIVIKGTTKGATSDDTGKFFFNDLANDAILVISGVNIETVERPVNGQNTIHVYVKTKVTSNEGVTVTVNTGYQSLSKERSAGSFSKPNDEILKNRSTSMNILQRLDGLVPGLTLSSSPGNEPLLIRGLNSVNATRTPLIIVDGIPMSSVTSINPQDVADITVLKDATAASIWGAKASNGVIVITTKKSSANEKLKVDYDAFYSFFGKPDLDYLPVLNSQQYIQTAKEIFDPVAYPWNTVTAPTSGGMPPHELILYNQYRGLISAAQANKSLDSLASINNVQQIKDIWYRNAALMNHTVSLSAGGKIHSIYGSLSFTNNQSNKPGEEDKTYKVNLRQDFNFNKRFQFYLITDLTNQVTSAARYITVDPGFYPYQLFRDASGNNLSIPSMSGFADSVRTSAENRSRISLDYNPLDDANLGSTKSNAFLNRIVGGATIKLFKGLRFEGVYGYVKGNNKTTIYDDNKIFRQRRELVYYTVAATPAATPIYYLPVSGGKYTVANSNQRDWTVRNQFVFDRGWENNLHQITLLAGQEAMEQLTNTNTSTVRGYNPDLLTYVSVDYATLSSTGVTGPVLAQAANRSMLTDDIYRESESQSRNTSYYANGAYTYNHRYSVNGSWRIDKSNLFGLDKSAQNRPVWSAGLKWMMGEERFMRSLTFINSLALRGTLGVTGNSPLPGTASSYDVLIPVSSNFVPGSLGMRVNTAANPRLTWESTQTINFGLDFSLLNNRLIGSFDLYQKKTDNLIGQMPINSLSGFPVIIGNYGSLKNNGFEIALTSANIATRNFSWTSILNLAYNKNKIIELNTSTPVTTGAALLNRRYYSGYPAFAAFAYDFAGLDSLGDPKIYLNDKTITKVRNAAKPGDMEFMGTTQAPWSGGLTNIFTYKGFSLTVNTIFYLGNVMRRDVGVLSVPFFTNRLINPVSAIFIGGLTQGNLHPDFLRRWKKPGDENSTNVPSYVSNVSLSNTRRAVDYYIYGNLNVLDASYIKMRDIILAYTLPKNLLNRIKTNNITLRVQLSNLMVWKANHWGIDPEFQGIIVTQGLPGNPESGYNGIRNVRTNQGTITVGAHVSF